MVPETEKRKKHVTVGLYRGVDLLFQFRRTIQSTDRLYLLLIMILSDLVCYCDDLPYFRYFDFLLGICVFGMLDLAGF